MKKNELVLFLGIFVFAFIVFVSCQKNDSTDDSATNPLSLKAPSGMLIAKSMSDLQSKTMGVISAVFGGKLNFTIIKIDYLPIKEGYACKVHYRLSDGYCGSYALCFFENYTEIHSDSGSVVHNVSSTSKGGYSVKYQCQGSCGCRIQSVIYPDGHITVNCSCDDCSLIMSIVSPGRPVE